MRRVFSFNRSVEGFNQTVERKLLKASDFMRDSEPVSGNIYMIVGGGSTITASVGRDV